MIRVDATLSDLIQPGLVVQVDPLLLLYLPVENFVNSRVDNIN